MIITMSRIHHKPEAQLRLNIDIKYDQPVRIIHFYISYGASERAETISPTSPYVMIP